jgi:hypothetical protein
MALRPLGDGMSCVAVAMPQAAPWGRGGTTDAAPELRRMYAAVGVDNGVGGRSPNRLPMNSDDNVGEAQRRVTNQKGMRGAKRVGGRRASACVYGKEGRDEAYQSRPAAGKEAQGTACKEVSLFVSTKRLCLGGDLSAQAASSWCT